MTMIFVMFSFWLYLCGSDFAKCLHFALDLHVNIGQREEENANKGLLVICNLQFEKSERC